MKKIFVILLLCATRSAFGQSFVHVQHNKLVDATGAPVQLNAVNLGGWLLWEGWIWGSGFIKEADIKSRLQQLMGPEKYNAFLEPYYNHFITEKDIALIGQSGFNSIRLPLNHRLFAADTPPYANGFTLIDKVVQWCRQYKLYLFVDLHAAPGGQSSYFISDPEGQTLWQSADNRAKTVALWKSIATRYRNEPVIAGYDLLNEPNAPNVADLVSFYKELVPAIRSADPNHLLIVEGNKLAHTFKGFPTNLGDDNQIYSYHYYAWTSENRKATALQEIVKEIPGSRPVWCGEWGEDTPKNLAEVKGLLNAVPNTCGTAFWTWKRVYKNNGRLPLCTASPGAAWNRLATWLIYRLVKPKPDEIEKGIASFLNAIALENCTVNSGVVSAVVP